MLLSVAFVPPRDVLDEVAALVAAVGTTPAELELVGVADLQLSVCIFGNVTRSDTVHLVNALTRASAGWPTAPTLRFSGGAALEFPGDTAVWIKADGDIEALADVARSIAPAVARLGFAVDRRRYRPWLPVARVTPLTELPVLEKVMARLDAYTGPEWSADRLSLIRTTFDASRSGPQGFEVIREIPLPTA